MKCKLEWYKGTAKQAQPNRLKELAMRIYGGLRSFKSYTSGMAHYTILVYLTIDSGHISMKFAEVEVSAKTFKIVGGLPLLRRFFSG